MHAGAGACTHMRRRKIKRFHVCLSQRVDATATAIDKQQRLYRASRIHIALDHMLRSLEYIFTLNLVACTKHTKEKYNIWKRKYFIAGRENLLFALGFVCYFHTFNISFFFSLY